MERRKEEEVGGVIMRFLRQAGLETPLNEHRLIELWPEVAGPEIAGQTGEMSIYNQVLHVQIRQAALRNQLFMQRSRYVEMLNRAVGAQVITDIALKA